MLVACQPCTQPLQPHSVCHIYSLKQIHSPHSVCCRSSNSSKKIPNLYFGAISSQQLRHRHGYISLPDVESVQIAGPRSYRYVQQGSDLWAALHAGRLTTSRAKDAIGLAEPLSSNISKAPRYGNSGSVRTAFEHLCHPLYDAPVNSADYVSAVAQNELLRNMYSKKCQATSPPSALGATDSVSAHLSSQGLTRMRLHWGNAQEPAALACVQELFPWSQLEEVGLYTLPEGMILASGMDPAELPAVGASPDGVICHRLPITAATLKAARAVLHAATACNPTSPETISKMATASASTLLAEALQSVSPDASGKPATRHTGQAGVLRLTGMKTVSGEPLKGVQSRNATDSGASWLPLDDRLVVTPAAWLLSALLSTDEQLHVAPGTGERDAEGTVWLLMREVVEVKNHLPFAIQPRSASSKIVIRDRGPLAQISPHWVPQLQLHCASTGCSSVLLMSRSATKGLRVFRMARCDKYINSMLELFRLLVVRYVLQVQAPPANPFILNDGYVSFLEKTAHLAASAILVTSSNSSITVAGSDQRLFI